MEASPAGGVVGFINRTRAEHHPTFSHTDLISERYPNGVVYSGCSCDRFLGCSYPYFLLHIDDLIAAYNTKVQDLARETLRTSELMRAQRPSETTP